MAEPRELPRVLAPVPTPFGEGGAGWDEDLLRRHLAFLVEGGVEGIVPLGTNGEFASLAHREKLEFLGLALRAAGELRVVPHVGATAVGEVLELAALAEEGGAAALLVMPPYYFKRVEAAGVAAFLEPLLAATKLPVLLYHFPALSGVPVTEELLRRLGGRVAGLKDSSGEVGNVPRFLSAAPGLRVYAGNDHALGPFLDAGGHGGITMAANVFPRLVREVVLAAGEGRRAAQARLGRARSLLERYPQPAACKFLLGLLGVGEAPVRPPLRPLAAGERAELEAGFLGCQAEMERLPGPRRLRS